MAIAETKLPKQSRTGALGFWKRSPSVHQGPYYLLCGPSQDSRRLCQRQLWPHNRRCVWILGRQERSGVFAPVIWNCTLVGQTLPCCWLLLPVTALVSLRITDATTCAIIWNKGWSDMLWSDGFFFPTTLHTIQAALLHR